MEITPTACLVVNTARASPQGLRLASRSLHMVFVCFAWVGGWKIREDLNVINICVLYKNSVYDRARWLRRYARYSHSGDPGFKSRGRPTWLRFFSGFLNLKIAMELVIFKEKCQVGPHIPLLMI